MGDPAAEPATRLARRLGLPGAVLLGLGSMLGTGVFLVFAPAAAAAGTGLLLGLALAALVAYANATSSAQLAGLYPESGGTYVYGRERLGGFWGYLAGVAFLAGKLASCGAAALLAGAYVAPDQRRVVAALAVAAVTALNYQGVTKTAGTAGVLAVGVVVVLGIVIAAGAAAPTPASPLGPLFPRGAAGVLGAAGLLFFAFAGYARIATLGEEVRDPARTIPRAITLALGIALLIYLAVAVAALHALGPQRLASATAPLAAVVAGGPLGALTPVVRFGGAAAALGSFLSLITGISRTAFAMAAGGDLPRWLAAVHPRTKVPHHAELAAGGVILIVVCVGGVVAAVGFSAFTILLYYAVTNASSLTLRPHERRWPRWFAAFGLLGCLTLAAGLPVTAVVSGAALLAVAAVVRVARRTPTRRRGAGGAGPRGRIPTPPG